MSSRRRAITLSYCPATCGARSTLHVLIWALLHSAGIAMAVRLIRAIEMPECGHARIECRNIFNASLWLQLCAGPFFVDPLALLSQRRTYVT